MLTKARLFSVMAGLAIGSVAVAQGSQITSAGIAINREDFASAKEHIDEATSQIEASGMEDLSEKETQKYYFYQGQIYSEFVNQALQAQQTPELANVTTSINSYLSLLDYNYSVDDDRYEEEVLEALPYLFTNYSDVAAGVSQSDKKAAFEMYGQLAEWRARQEFEKTDSLSIYYQAILGYQLQNDANLDSAKRAEYRDQAISKYASLIEMGYAGRAWTAIYGGNRVTFPNKETVDYYVEQGNASEPELSPSVEPDLWVQYIDLLAKAGRDEEFNTALQEARAKYPENQSIFLTVLQKYFNEENYDGAVELMAEGLENEPNNTLFLYNTGYVYHVHKNDPATGLEYYKRTIAVDSTHEDALYMAGLVHVELSNDKSQEMNDLPSSASQSQYDALKVERDELLQQALSYFERAEAVNPEASSTAQSLAEVHYKLGNGDKAVMYNEKAAALKAQGK